MNIKLKYFNEVLKLKPRYSRYVNNNNIYIGLYDKKELFCALTVNIDDLTDDYITVDCIPGVDTRELMKENGLGEIAYTTRSGYNSYDVYKISETFKKNILENMEI